jgi:hypothetical protein
MTLPCGATRRRRGEVVTAAVVTDFQVVFASTLLCPTSLPFVSSNSFMSKPGCMGADQSDVASFQNDAL